MYVFGTQYLRGATPERDQWERDMANMREMGFNTIRAWLVWNSLERFEGEIDHEYIDSFLRCAEKNDLQVGLLFHMHACPPWAVQKYSKYFYVNEDDLPFEPAIRANTPSGGWPGLCFDNEEVREIEARFIQGVVRETAKHKNVAFYEPMNEPHEWIDMSKKPNGMFCYCPASVKKFRIWLQKKYGDIETLNRAWGHYYGSFDEVRPPRWMISYSDYCDFRIFTMDNIAEEITFRRDLIKACDNRPVIAHAWGGGAITCAQLGGMAFDDWKNAAGFDKWGFSAFPGNSKPGTLATLGLSSDSTRCAANGKEFWQSELTAGMVGTGLWQYGRLDDDTFSKLQLESIRHGAQGLLFWQYRKERFGSEIGGYSMTDNAGGPTNLSRCASRLCNALQKNDEGMHKGKLDKAEVAIVFSIRSYLANWCSFNRADNRFAIDSTSGYYRMFWEENIPTDILHEDFFGDLSGYKLIVVPTPYAVSAKMAKALKEFVKNGGTVISDPYFGAFDENYQLARCVPGFGMEEVFGCVADNLTICKKLTLNGESGTMALDENGHKETYKVTTAKPLFRYENGEAAILENTYGSGKAVMSGVNLGLVYSARALIGDDFNASDAAGDSTAAKNFVLSLAKAAGVKGNPCATAGVVISHLKTGDDCAYDLAIVLNCKSEAVLAPLACGRTYADTSVAFGTCAGASVSGDTVTFDLPANGCGLVRLTK